MQMLYIDTPIASAAWKIWRSRTVLMRLTPARNPGEHTRESEMATENKGFDLKKPVLMLSAAVIVLGAAPALADDWTDITTGVTVPVDTAHAANGSPGDIKIDTGGSISFSKSGTNTTPQPAVTINSNNSFNQITGTSVSVNNTDQAVGILVDLSNQTLDANNHSTSCGALPMPCHTTTGSIAAGTIN